MAVWLMINITISSMLPSVIYAEETDVQGTAGEQSETDLGLTSKANILMEASTGTVIYEKNADEKLSPASITKIMTLILIFDALEKGQITLDDTVTTSEYAKSMGGSQVFLEQGEVQTVDTLIKCIIVASGNDACVAMAEYIEGSETEFVRKMNERAAGLGMTNTNFEDCCGLTDSDGHYTSARDVAIMSRELITKYPAIFNYSGIWMENITHVTEKGTSEFGLANTNKLLKQYQWTTGLKTGSTSKAKYCVSATARKDNVDLIAVVMAAPDYKVRFSEAASMLDYGFAHCNVYQDINEDKIEPVRIVNGIKEYANAEYAGKFSYLSTTGENVGEIKKKINLSKELTAPVKKGDVVGSAEYFLGDKSIGSVQILAAESVRKSQFSDCLKKLINALWI
jgi:D-alanyl-D-alanine carboxypeptidase (penicillin-binding protein 5/6)